MQHATIEINELKEEYTKMWCIVEQQVRNSFKAIEQHDRGLAKSIMVIENKVNAQELVLDSACERFLVLFAPVAIDLRFAISMIKINNNLERIGDFANSLAMFTYHYQDAVLDEKLTDGIKWDRLTALVLEMMEVVKNAFDREDSSLARDVLRIDDEVDNLKANSVQVLADYIRLHPDKTEMLLHFNTVIRRIERMADRLSNIAEDLVFYFEAKELRHTMSKNKDIEE